MLWLFSGFANNKSVAKLLVMIDKSVRCLLEATIKGVNAFVDKQCGATFCSLGMPIFSALALFVRSLR